jgi:hypothetical protein
MQHLEQALAVVHVCPQDLMAQDLDLVRQHHGGAAAQAAIAGLDLNEVLPQRLAVGHQGMGVLDAAQVGHRDQLEGPAGGLLGSFEGEEADGGYFHVGWG